MDRKTRSLLVTLLTLALVETGLRLDAGDPADAGWLPSDRPTVLVLGSSRSLRGLRPRTIEETLVEHGVDAWAINLAKVGHTTIGTYRSYLEEISPLARAPSDHPRVLAIEVRGSGMNDAFIPTRERDWLERMSLPPLGDRPAHLPPAGVLANLRAGQLEAAARVLLGSMWIARGRETLRPRLEDWWSRRAGQSAPGAGTDTGEMGMSAADGKSKPWRTEEKGWRPFTGLSASEQRWSSLEQRYRTRQLKNYTLGGVQAHALVVLLRRARRDGFRPVLHIMPLTDVHRGFYEPGDYDAFRALVAEIAAAEGVPVVDLDGDLALPPSAFYDTHHVNGPAADTVSRRFAEGILPETLE